MKKYYDLREEEADKEKEINTACWRLLKSMQDTVLKRCSRWNTGIKETINIDVSGIVLNITTSSGIVGNPIDADVKIIGWTVRTQNTYSELNSMDLAVTISRLNNAPCEGINITALYLILTLLRDNYEKV